MEARAVSIWWKVSTVVDRSCRAFPVESTAERRSVLRVDPLQTGRVIDHLDKHWTGSAELRHRIAVRAASGEGENKARYPHASRLIQSRRAGPTSCRSGTASEAAGPLICLDGIPPGTNGLSVSVKRLTPLAFARSALVLNAKRCVRLGRAEREGDSGGFRCSSRRGRMGGNRRPRRDHG